MESRDQKFLSEFIAMITHELRTPLTVIKEAVSVLKEEIDGPLNEQQHETLAICQSGIARLNRLIQNVLNFSRIDTGQFEMNMAPADVNEIIRENAAFLRAAAQKKNIRLELHLPDQPVTAVCDADKIGQLAVNLAENALKFTPDHGRVDLFLSSGGNGVEIRVKDTGIGIPLEDQDKIFEIYRQSSGEKPRHKGGAGVGLAVCKKIAEQHGGTIGLQSEPGKGSEFIVRFPAINRPISSSGSPLAPAGLAQILDRRTA